jgi:hypothetical protein
MYMICKCVSEEGDDGEAARSETPSLLSYTLRYETGQGIMCVKEDIGKYDMWYGVVSKAVMSCTSVVFSLGGGRDTVSYLTIKVISQV